MSRSLLNAVVQHNFRSNFPSLSTDPASATASDAAPSTRCGLLPDLSWELPGRFFSRAGGGVGQALSRATSFFADDVGVGNSQANSQVEDAQRGGGGGGGKKIPPYCLGKFQNLPISYGPKNTPYFYRKFHNLRLKLDQKNQAGSKGRRGSGLVRYSDWKAQKDWRRKHDLALYEMEEADRASLLAQKRRLWEARVGSVENGDIKQVKAEIAELKDHLKYDSLKKLKKSKSMIESTAEESAVSSKVRSVDKKRGEDSKVEESGSVKESGSVDEQKTMAEQIEKKEGQLR